MQLAPAMLKWGREAWPSTDRMEVILRPKDIQEVMIVDSGNAKLNEVMSSNTWEQLQATHMTIRESG